jgi:hypothetical protein
MTSEGHNACWSSPRFLLPWCCSPSATRESSIPALLAAKPLQFGGTPSPIDLHLLGPERRPRCPLHLITSSTGSGSRRGAAPGNVRPIHAVAQEQHQHVQHDRRHRPQHHHAGPKDTAMPSHERRVLSNGLQTKFSPERGRIAGSYRSQPRAIRTLQVHASIGADENARYEVEVYSCGHLTYGGVSRAHGQPLSRQPEFLKPFHIGIPGDDESHYKLPFPCC